MTSTLSIPDAPLEWAREKLANLSYSIRQEEIVLTTPWSKVVRFSTSSGTVYLKQTPATSFLSIEPKIIRLLFEQFHANVPHVIAINDECHCFLMNDCGKSLRSLLKSKFNPKLLSQAIEQYGAIQRSTEGHIETFLKLGIPDWRLDKLPALYNELISKTEFLISEGLTSKELNALQHLSTHFSEQCGLLSTYGIPETLGYHDFHDNNVLVDQSTEKLIFMDWSEVAIIHPFFSLQTCLQQSIKHHNVKEGDQTYRKLQETCLKNWSGLASKNQLSAAFDLAKQVYSIFSVQACYQFMVSVDLKAYKAYYADRPSKITENFKSYIALALGGNPL
ncbi:MAG: hypothetical protein RLZ35_335 [Pseudomonadota bacterium]|jgi:hypothetical protein